MRITISDRSSNRCFPTSNSIVDMILTIMRNTVSLIMVWTIVSSITPNQLQTKAIKASPYNFVVNQDDEDIMLKIKGDDSDHWITNQYDFTVIRDKEGKYKFATMSSDEKQVVISTEMARNSRPKCTKTQNLRPQRKRPKSGDEIALYNELVVTPSTVFTRPKGCKKGGVRNSCDIRKDNASYSSSSPYETDTSGRVVSNGYHRRVSTSTQSIGVLRNLVILIQFEDHQDRQLPTKDDIKALMNSEDVGDERAPTGSLKTLYQKSSYGQLTIESEVTDWILLDNTEEYYADGVSGLSSMLHDALRYSLNELESNDYVFGDFDADGDLSIDSITFLTSGYGAEWGSVDSSGAGYEDRIWSHKWSISGGWRSARTGVRVANYFVSPSLWDTSGNEIGRVGVIAHEIGHFLDLPDLYDTDDSGNGLGFFCLMANSWGSDGTQFNPPELSAWSKIQLGWTAPKTPLIGEENRVSRSEEEPTSEAPEQVFKIGDGKFGFPGGEYLLIEFRKSNKLLGGIAIYHVDEQSDYDIEGYPDQVDNGMEWPANGNHYKIALLPADNSFELERGINHGTSSDLYGFGQSLLPSEGANGPFPNTDSYQNGLVQQTGVRICITSDVERPYMTFLFADKNPSWITLLSEDFENQPISTAVSFVSDAKVKRNKNKCKDFRCVGIKTSSASMSITVKTVCLTEIRVSFKLYSLNLKQGEKIILEYLRTDTDGSDWTLLETWTRTNGGANSFRNKEWISNSVYLPLVDPESNTVVKFRLSTTSLKRKMFIDDLEIEGKF